MSGVTEDRITKWLFGEGSLGSLSTFVSMMQQFFRELGVMILLFTLFALIFKFIQYRTENSQETEDPGLTDAAIAPDDQQAS